jgi:hypothetical protein
VRATRSPNRQSAVCVAVRARVLSGRTHHVLGDQHPCFAIISGLTPPAAAQSPCAHRAHPGPSGAAPWPQRAKGWPEVANPARRSRHCICITHV